MPVKTDTNLNPKLSRLSKLGRRAHRDLALNSIVVVLATIVSLLLSELAVRIFAPQSLISDIVMGDPDVDYRLRPNATGFMSSPEYAAEVHINSLGFRGTEVSLKKKPDVTRVLFLGDSYVFGHGLRDNETLPFMVGEDLEHIQPGKFEVINAGVYGYSTANELDLFVKYGLPLKPDLVAIVVMVHDMFDNPTWYKLGSGGELVRKHPQSQYVASRRITRYIPAANWLREHSHLFKFVGVRLLPTVKSGIRKNSEDSFPSNRSRAEMDERFEEFYRQKDGPFALTAAILNRITKIAKENGSRSLMLTLGGKSGFKNGRMEAAYMLPHTKLIQAALKSGFAEAIALSPILAGYRGKETLFFPKDGHWTAAAVRFVAPSVATVIARMYQG